MTTTRKTTWTHAGVVRIIAPCFLCFKTRGPKYGVLKKVRPPTSMWRPHSQSLMFIWHTDLTDLAPDECLEGPTMLSTPYLASVTQLPPVTLRQALFFNEHRCSTAYLSPRQLLWCVWYLIPQPGWTPMKQFVGTVLQPETSPWPQSQRLGWSKLFLSDAIEKQTLWYLVYGALGAPMWGTVGLIRGNDYSLWVYNSNYWQLAGLTLEL